MEYLNTETLERFLEDRRIHGVKEGSIATYNNYIRPFIKYARDKDPETVSWEFLRRYRSEATKKTAWTQIRVFIGWCASLGLCENWPARLKFRFGKVAQPATLTLEEFRKIMDSIPNTWQGRRDQALFYCLFFCGARRSSVAQLRRDDVSLTERTIRVLTKGAREMILTLPEVAIESLKGWLIISKRLDSEWVFPSIRTPQKHIDVQYLTHALPRYAQAAGFERRIFVHLLRHSFATCLFEAGIAMDQIQSALGHSQISTTANYVRRLNEAKRVRAAVDQTFGILTPAAPAPAPDGRAPQAKRRRLTGADVADWM